MKKIQRAYSILSVKSFDADKRELTGIATTPTTDRMGDVVEPKGAQFKLPIPLLWQHRSAEPIGEVYSAKVTSEGIEVKARLVKIDEPGKLKDRLDEAWQSLKSGLVKGLSIGFQALEYNFIENSKGGIHFLKWAWHELSAVTIPANAEATIQSIKNFDEQALAASGLVRKRVVHLAGASAIKPKVTEKDMKIADQIAAFEAKRLASSERMEALMAKAAEEGRTLDAEETEEYDTLESEVKEVDAHLVRLRSLERFQATKATPVIARAEDGNGRVVPTAAPITVRRNLPPGIEFARYAMCLAAAKGNLMQAHEIAKNVYPEEHRIQNYIKAQVAAGTAQHVTWAAPLAQADNQFVGDFVEYLRPATIVGKFGQNGIPALRSVPFNVTIPGQTVGGSGYWVGEGAAKPLTKFGYERTTFPYTKVANIAVITEELLRFSNPSAEALVRDSLAAALIERMDIDFVSPTKAAVSGVSPASITNTASPVSSTGGTDADAVRTDVKALMTNFISANISLSTGVWIMPATLALTLSLMRNALGQQEFPEISMTGGRFIGLPVIVSEHVPDVAAGSPTIARDILILVNASDVWLADDGGVSIDISREASLEMDTAPSMYSAGSGSPQTSVESAVVSMFQTNSIAIRAERYIHWAKRRSAAAQYLTGIKYTV